jgi:hypothetical protein
MKTGWMTYTTPGAIAEEQRQLEREALLPPVPPPPPPEPEDEAAS